MGRTLVGIVIGIALMVGGVALSRVEIEALKKLEEQGIPLNPGITIATIGVFLILFPVINNFFIQPLNNAIAERTEELERTFSEAVELRSEMERMRNDYERRLAQTEADAREQIQAQIKEAQNLRQTLVAEAAERADAMITRAQQEIDQERQRALSEIRTHVVDLSLAAAAKVVGENMDLDRNRKLVDDFIANVEVAR